MLSIGKLAHGQSNYYLSLAGERVDRSASCATGVEDYYVGGAEPPGRWPGDLAGDLGLEGADTPEQHDKVLDVDSEVEGSPQSRRPVRGFDPSFSAPKSVSVVFGTGGPAVR